MYIIERFKNSELLKGFAFTTFWNGLSKIITVVVTIICSNYLAPDGFGEFSYIRNTLNLIILVCAANFSSLAIKFTAESYSSTSSLKKLYILILFIVGVSIIVAITFLVMPVSFLSDVLNGYSVAVYLKISIVLLPIFILQPLLSAILRGCKAFNLVGFYEFSISLILLILIIVGIHLGNKHGAIIALLLYYLLASIAGIIFVFNYNKRIKLLVSVEEIVSQFSCIRRMIFPVFLMSFIEAPLNWWAQTELARLGGYSLVAVVSIIQTIRYLIQVFPSYFYQAFTPFISQYNAQGNYREYFMKFNNVVKCLFLIMLLLMPILIIGGKLLLNCFNRVYVNYYNVYIISLFIIPLLLYSALFKLNMMVKEHQKDMLFMTILSSVVFIFFFYVLIILKVDVLKSFFYAQWCQYSIQLIYSSIIYLKDKNEIH